MPCDFHELTHIINYDHLWNGYAKYLAADQSAAPRDLPFATKIIRFGKSFHDELLQDIAERFAHAKPRRELAAIGS